ncbi:Gryzun, putative trafficking through golgi-domain-containing protein [Gautieria morchelliformis]|nr:Gryzun, putative trafficking through golgi-domain-containing protein [Gautieria morchelliformis]
MFIAGLDVPPNNTQSDTDTSEDDRILGKRLQGDPFVLLTKRLREVLQEKSIKKGTVWVGDPDRAGPGFRMLLVDKNVRFPPQKAVGQDAHSPLSPLTQTSPLHPDGLIAPIWVRKHTELLPSVFVLFLRLYEYPGRLPSGPISPLHQQVFNEKDEERRREEERRRDSELSAEIAARKRGCSERGVKLTVVLMASRKMLDDPNLDTRLTYIRRQSGLDSRAALFVLSPVSTAELQEFVKRWSILSHCRSQAYSIATLRCSAFKFVNNSSLQLALHDAALEYYLTHSKRGTAYGHGGSFAPPSAVFSPRAPPQPLRPQGWIVRYEYKMACFAEFRGEEEVARKHFQTSWETLLDMFGSTAILPPRTKRWAEAKVLADCISVKIVKLYLYRAEHSRAIAHFNSHLTRFGTSAGGGALARRLGSSGAGLLDELRYRILAELLDMATLSTLTIPQSLPNFPIRPSTPPTPHQTPPQHSLIEPIRPAGVNPSSVLQHPGFYYYAAALCTQRRLEQFTAADQEFSLAAANVPINLTNERKVDHRVIILELYTKAYELFKKYSFGQGQSRLTFYVACRIAQTYHDSGKFDMAIRFFERIAKAYRKERWGTMLKPILSMWYTCARQIGDVESIVKLLIEMMGYGLPDEFEDGQLEEDLAAVLHSTSPSTTSFKIDFSDIHPLLHSSVVFWYSEISISQPAPFQLHLKAPNSVSLAVLSFVSIRLEFLHDQLPIIIHHRPPPEEAAQPQSLQLVNLGSISSQTQEAPHEVFADLRWPRGGTLVFMGTLVSDSPTTLSVSKFVMDVVEGHWAIEMTFDPSISRDFKPSQAHWLSHLDPPTFLPMQRDNPSATAVRHRPHLVDVLLSHPTPAYLDEEYPITISVTNVDDHDLIVVVDVLLHPAEGDTGIICTERSTSMIKGVAYGSLDPGETVSKTLVLHSTGASGDRTIDVSVQCEPSGTSTSSEVSSPVSPRTADTTETLHTLVIPTQLALQVDSLASYRRALQSSADPPLALTDLKSYDPSAFNVHAEAIIRSTIVNQGPWDVAIEKFSLLPQTVENTKTKLLSCSLAGEEECFPLHCSVGDKYSVVSRFIIFSEDEVELPEVLPPPGKYQISWSRLGSSGLRGAIAVTRISLPYLSVPRDNVDALLELPADGVLHVPMTITVTIRNRHPWRTADLYLQVEPSDHFVLSGLRSGSLPVLLAGSEEHLGFNLIPVSCGTVRLPTFKFLDRRKEKQEQKSGEENEVDKKVPVIDARLQERNEEGEEVRLMVCLPGEGESNRLRRVDADGLTMFITPS